MDEDLLLANLRDKAQEQLAEMEGIRARCANDNRMMVEEEEAAFDAAQASYDRTAVEIGRLERLEKQRTSAAASAKEPVGRRTAPQPVAVADDPVEPTRPQSGPRVTSANPRSRGPFKSLGEIAMRVHRSAITQELDPLLRPYMASLSTYASEGVGTDGGVLVPDDFRAGIVQHMFSQESLLSRTTQQVITGNQMTYVKSETTPWATSSGVQVYWASEAQAATQSKPAMSESSIRAHSLIALAPVTNELLEDAPALTTHLEQTVPEIMTSVVNDAILAGNGVGKPLGILTALDASSLGPTVSIAKESSQVAATLVGANVIKMYSRMPASKLGGAAWLVNQDLLPDLLRLTLPGRDNTGAAVTGWGSHVYLPPGQFNDSPYGLLLGKPVIAVESCSTLGTQGDIVFCNLSDYWTVRKSSGMKQDLSIHLWFDQNTSAFRWTFRIGGAPWSTAAVSPKNGTAKRSSFIVLDTRA